MTVGNNGTASAFPICAARDVPWLLVDSSFAGALNPLLACFARVSVLL